MTKLVTNESMIAKRKKAKKHAHLQELFSICYELSRLNEQYLTVSIYICQTFIF